MAKTLFIAVLRPIDQHVLCLSEGNLYILRSFIRMLSIPQSNSMPIQLYLRIPQPLQQRCKCQLGKILVFVFDKQVYPSPHTIRVYLYVGKARAPGPAQDRVNSRPYPFCLSQSGILPCYLCKGYIFFGVFYQGFIYRSIFLGERGGSKKAPPVQVGHFAEVGIVIPLYLPYLCKQRVPGILGKLLKFINIALSLIQGN